MTPTPAPDPNPMPSPDPIPHTPGQWATLAATIVDVLLGLLTQFGVLHLTADQRASVVTLTALLAPLLVAGYAALLHRQITRLLKP